MTIKAKSLKIYVKERKTTQNGKERKFKTYFTYVKDLDNKDNDLPVTIKFRQDAIKGDFKDTNAKVDAVIDIPGYLIYEKAKDTSFDYADMRRAVREKKDYAYIWIREITHCEELEKKQEDTTKDYNKLNDFVF